MCPEYGLGRGGTRHAEWDCGWLGKVHCVRIGIMDGLKRCPEYGLIDDC
jgi:hypothetical protein